MSLNIAREMTNLQKMKPVELRAKHEEVFGEATRTGNRAYLIKRIAWRLQANAEGDLSERARQRAMEIADDADLRVSAPPTSASPIARVGPDTHHTTKRVGFANDKRLPMPGTVLVRNYKGTDHHVTVLPDGFEYAGETYRSLSGVAKAITGTHCNGFLFFRLNKDGGKQ